MREARSLLKFKLFGWGRGVGWCAKSGIYKNSTARSGAEVGRANQWRGELPHALKGGLWLSVGNQ